MRNFGGGLATVPTVGARGTRGSAVQPIRNGPSVEKNVELLWRSANLVALGCAGWKAEKPKAREAREELPHFKNRRAVVRTNGEI